MPIGSSQVMVGVGGFDDPVTVAEHSRLYVSPAVYPVLGVGVMATLIVTKVNNSSRKVTVQNVIS